MFVDSNFNYFFVFKLKRTFYNWWVCLRPHFKKFKSLFVFFIVYIVVFFGGVVVSFIASEVIIWNRVSFTSDYEYVSFNDDWWLWFQEQRYGYSAAAEMPWSRRYNKDRFYYNFTDLKKRRLISRRVALTFSRFTSSRRSTLIFNRIERLSNTKFKHFPNKHFPRIGERMFFHLYGGRVPKNLYRYIPALQKKPSGRFGGLKGFSIPNPRYIVKRPEVMAGYITYILPKGFYWDTFFWNKAIQKYNLLGYRVLPLGVLPIEDGFFTIKGTRFSEFLKGSRVKVFDFRFFELSLLNPGLLVDKRNGSGMVVAFVHPAFYRISRNTPVNHFFRDYIRQIKNTGMKDPVIALYLTLLFSDPDMFCYYLPRAIKFVFVDYSVAQAKFLRDNSRYTLPISTWNMVYTYFNYNKEPSVQLRTAQAFIYRVARKQ